MFIKMVIKFICIINIKKLKINLLHVVYLKYEHLFNKLRINKYYSYSNKVTFYTHFLTTSGFSLRIEVAGEYYKITGESGHSEEKLTSSFYRLMKFSRKIPCSSRRILRSPMLNEHPALEVSHFNRFHINFVT